MKKSFSLVLVLVVAALSASLVAGCGSSAPSEPTPSDSVKGALDAIKAQDAETAKGYFSANLSEQDASKLAGDMGANGVNLDAKTIESLTEEQQAALKEVAATVLDFDYTLGNEQVNGDTATVDVTVTTRDLGAVFNETMSGYITQAFAAATSGSATEEEMATMFIKAFSETLAKHPEKSYTGTTTVSLSKDEGEWKLNTPTEDNIDCLFGGIYSTVMELANSFSSLDMSALDGSQSTDNAA